MSASPPVLIENRLLHELEEAGERTIELVADLTHDQLMGPRLSTTNPLLWDIGHSAWFQEFWVLRHFHHQAPILRNADELYNSAEVAHDTRWDLSLPSFKETVQYKRRVLERVFEWHGKGKENGQQAIDGYDETYFLKLALLHEYMHAEAIAYTRQTLGYAAPRLPVAAVSSPPNAVVMAASLPPIVGDRPLRSISIQKVPGDARIPGGTYSLGSARGSSFVFDNEQWAHPVEVRPFAISQLAVTQREFAAFVDDAGYARKEFWSAEGWQWREKAAAKHPVYWRCLSPGKWQRRNFDQWVPLADDWPVLHVNWFEAEAYCRWAKRRLPTDVEWEMAASVELSPDGHGIAAAKRRYPWGSSQPVPEQANLDWRGLGCVPVDAHAAGDSAFGCRQMIGNVWEWTATDFGPYPGFAPGPYKEYSAPWFGDHKVLRGGCWATRSGLISNAYRNFYKPDRRDVWAGFRTCALD